MAPPHPQIDTDSTLTYDSLFDLWLLQSLQRITNHCETSSIRSLSLTCSIGVDNNDLKDHGVDLGDTSTAADSQATQEPIESESD